jgi:phosphoglycolate phosphatase-like HAD superfamily hydrolase
MVHLILFDIDGTLISAKGAGSRALSKTVGAVWNIEVDISSLHLDGKTDPLIVREALELVNSEHVFDGKFDENFLTLYEGFLVQELKSLRHFEILDGVVSLLDTLKERDNVLLGIATGNVAIGAKRKLEMAKLDHYFSFGGYGSDASSRTDIIRKAIQRGQEASGHPLGETIVIGDTPHDIRSGQEAGTKTVGVATGRFTLNELRSHFPTKALRSLRPIREIIRFLDEL